MRRAAGKGGGRPTPKNVWWGSVAPPPFCPLRLCRPTLCPLYTFIRSVVGCNVVYIDYYIFLQLPNKILHFLLLICQRGRKEILPRGGGGIDQMYWSQWRWGIEEGVHLQTWGTSAPCPLFRRLCLPFLWWNGLFPHVCPTAAIATFRRPWPCGPDKPVEHHETVLGISVNAAV